MSAIGRQDETEAWPRWLIGATAFLALPSAIPPKRTYSQPSFPLGLTALITLLPSKHHSPRCTYIRPYARLGFEWQCSGTRLPTPNIRVTWTGYHFRHHEVLPCCVAHSPVHHRSRALDALDNRRSRLEACSSQGAQYSAFPGHCGQ